MSDEEFIAALDRLDDGLHRPANSRAYSLEDVLVTGDEPAADVPRPKPAQPRVTNPRRQTFVAPIAFVIGVGMGSGALLAVLIFGDRVAAMLAP